MNIYIKNMVCPRCISAVDRILAGLGIKSLSIQLGEVILEKELTVKQLPAFSMKLKELGFLTKPGLSQKGFKCAFGSDDENHVNISPVS